MISQLESNPSWDLPAWAARVALGGVVLSETAWSAFFLWFALHLDLSSASSASQASARYWLILLLAVLIGGTIVTLAVHGLRVDKSTRLRKAAGLPLRLETTVMVCLTAIQATALVIGAIKILSQL